MSASSDGTTVGGPDSRLARRRYGVSGQPGNVLTFKEKSYVTEHMRLRPSRRLTYKEANYDMCTRGKNYITALIASQQRRLID
jgi:hypothetical protein